MTAMGGKRPFTLEARIVVGRGSSSNRLARRAPKTREEELALRRFAEKNFTRWHNWRAYGAQMVDDPARIVESLHMGVTRRKHPGCRDIGRNLPERPGQQNFNGLTSARPDCWGERDRRSLQNEPPKR